MRNYFHQRLGIRLFAAFVGVIVLSMIMLVLAVQITARPAFSRYMQYRAMRMGMGMRLEAARELLEYRDFRRGVHEAVGWAALVAVGIAAGVSLVLSRRIVAPLQAMTVASQRIAQGKYDERVDVSGQDELGQLAASFNHMASQLEQMETMRRQLIGDVSHELRTPLTAIKGWIEGLLDGVLPAEPETYRQILAETERLNRLVNDLQELSRVEAPTFRLEWGEVDLNTLFKVIVRRLSPAAQAKGLTLKVDMPTSLPRLAGDEDRLTQVLTNLVSNAIQYTPEGGTITLSARVVNDQVEISVTDTGIGIPPEHLEFIFTRFYRVDRSRSRATGGGSGVGLTIAQRLVQAHGGRIWAESEGPGKGSRFVFTVPLRRSER